MTPFVQLSLGLAVELGHLALAERRDLIARVREARLHVTLVTADGPLTGVLGRPRGDVVAIEGTLLGAYASEIEALVLATPGGVARTASGAGLPALPELNERGELPPGVHAADWSEFVARFGRGARRVALLGELYQGIRELQRANCDAVYVGGSLVSAKPEPGDVDALYDPRNMSGRDPGELGGLRSLGTHTPDGERFLDLFQRIKDHGGHKGVVRLDLRTF